MTTAAAIDAFLQTRRKGTMISLADAVLAVRGTAPDCELTDAELAGLIAHLAVVAGFNVAFDLERQAALEP